LAAALRWRYERRPVSPWVDGGIVAALILLAAGVLLAMGRTPWGPSGEPGLISLNVQSQENSQRFLDAYTFTHLLHGVGLYWLLWLVGRRWSLGFRGVLAAGLEGTWEVFENTDLIINRYREATLSLHYYGDSVLNVSGDITAALLAFALAARLPTWVMVGGVVLIEAILALAIRDNLFLNILLLIYPIPSVQEWQLSG
jgi:hypothetical protein